MCVCALGVQRSMGAFLSHSLCYILRQHLSLNLDFTSLARPAWPESRWICQSLPSQNWDCSCELPHPTFMWVLGIKLRLSWLHSKHLVPVNDFESAMWSLTLHLRGHHQLCFLVETEFWFSERQHFSFYCILWKVRFVFQICFFLIKILGIANGRKDRKAFKY